MKLLTIPAIIAASVCMGGCVSMLSGPTPTIDMAYVTDNPRGAGVVQVFEIGTNTVVQVRNIDTVRPIIEDASGRPLKYQIYGQNAVLEGRHNVFRVVTLHGTSTVKRNDVEQGTLVNLPLAGSPAAARSPAPTSGSGIPAPAITFESAGQPMADGASNDAVTQTADDTPEALQAEIDRMKKELEEIKALLSQGAGAGSSRTLQSPDKPLQRTLQSSTVIVQFADNSDRFEPNVADRQAIRELAHSATKVRVFGYTDSFTATHHAKALATLRAYAAKEYLVAEGVDPSKISVKAIPSGSFIADNRTKEGKAANRRVEITVL